MHGHFVRKELDVSMFLSLECWNLKLLVHMAEYACGPFDEKSGDQVLVVLYMEF